MSCKSIGGITTHRLCREVLRNRERCSFFRFMVAPKFKDGDVVTFFIFLQQPARAREGAGPGIRIENDKDYNVPES